MNGPARSNGLLVKSISYLVAGAGVTIGMGYVGMVFELYRTNKQVLPDVIDQAPLFVIVMFGLSLGYHVMLRGLEELKGFTAQQTRVADALTLISQRDDQRAQAQEAALRYVAAGNDQILEAVKRLPCQHQPGQEGLPCGH